MPGPFNPLPDKIFPIDLAGNPPIAVVINVPKFKELSSIMYWLQKNSRRAKKHDFPNNDDGTDALSLLNMSLREDSRTDCTTKGPCMDARLGDTDGPGGTNRLVTMPEHAPPPAAFR